MTTVMQQQVSRIVEVYRQQGGKLPLPRAFALRLIEEAVELCLACGASVRDVHQSVDESLANEHEKDLNRGFDAERVAERAELIGEIADVALLARMVSHSAEVDNEEVEIAAILKVDRLRDAARAGTLFFLSDGRKVLGSARSPVL